MEHNEYIKYLENLGFKESTEKYKTLMKEKFPNAISLDYLWYVYEGDLIVEEIKMSNIPLLITGDLTINQPVVEVEEYGGLMVFGITKVQYMELVGYGYFLGGIEFEILASILHGAQKYIYNPKGKFLYRDSENTTIKNIEEDKVDVFLDTVDYESFGDVTKLLSKEYLWWHEEDGFITFEEYKIENGEDSDYADYLEETEIDIEVRKIFKAIQAGKEVFLK